MRLALRHVLMVLLASLSVGCVTINIYFPAAAAEAAADRIIEEVWQLREPTASPPADNTGAAR